jgi:hypothetical protein
MLFKGRYIILFECRVLQNKSQNLEKFKMTDKYLRYFSQYPSHKETSNCWRLIDPATTISVFYFV